MELNYPIGVLKGMGPKTREVFHQHGILTLEDLLYFFPRGWMDASTVVPLSDLRVGKPALIDVQIVTIKEGMSQRSRLPYMRCLVADTTGSTEVMWFHPRFLRPKVKVGARFLLHGTLNRLGNAISMVSPKFIDTPSVIPVYSQIGGMPPHKLKPLMQQLRPLIKNVPDYLPTEIREQQGLLSLAETLEAMHFPRSIDHIAEAKKRLAFDELLMIVMPSLMNQEARDKEQVGMLSVEQSTVTEWASTLPFSLTDDQQKVISEILADLSQSRPMNRLVQGDVGSGKTAVGLAAAIAVMSAKKQVVWLAPTELLAAQHFATAQKLLPDSFSVGLWTRSHHATRDIPEKAPLERVLGQQFIIGTHALLQDNISLTDLGLLIIDEQHRFGVNQRAKLRTFGGQPVHLLSMTATPIPRTMALLVYADLRLSVIKQMPAGRKPVTTRVVTEENRPKAYDFIEQHISHGEQVYVVCPSIEPAQDDEASIFNNLFESVDEKKAVTTWVHALQVVFPQRTIQALHGKMKAAEKQEIMQAFRAGKIDILVSTTVIEVGVDVPNATFMVIENAERFGLAQLHQLRGRVGRGEKQSFCLLFPTNDAKKENERLQLLESTTDGFVLAEKDLELRGPGELTGLAQSGLPSLQYASLLDAQLVETVKKVAEQLLHNTLFAASLDRFWRFYHPE
jgi:ATP-dependent DNA helicase RecG